MVHRLVGPTRARSLRLSRISIEECLYHGDSRAALVMSVSPLLVAAYTDEMDCVVMLNFAEELVQEYDLKIGSRVLTANSYFSMDVTVPLQEDLEEGSRTLRNHVIVMPLIVEFLSDCRDRIESRKAEISDEEWSRTQELAEKYLARHGARARDGRPRYCGQAAEKVVVAQAHTGNHVSL